MGESAQGLDDGKLDFLDVVLESIYLPSFIWFASQAWVQKKSNAMRRGMTKVD